MKNILVIVFLSFFSHFAIGQEQTIGLLSYRQHLTYEGYTLFFPREQSIVYLINNCGEIVHQWDDDDIYVPNNAVYLLENGDLLKCKKHNNGVIGTGNGDYFIELLSWDNELIWSYELNTVDERLHHDIERLPNGNVLMIAWERKSFETAIENGRLPETMTNNVLFPDFIFEIDPNTNERVWEWHVWDHLIQDVDSTKLNFGVVSEHPELVDINYVENVGALDWDWLHINAVDYNEALDQIMLCVPYFYEIWIIDHSTTSEEAAGHAGGNSGKGGDLLYRVGNPLSYKRGTEEDKILFFPHDTHWANSFLEADHPHADKILVFNNRVPGNISKMEIFEDPWHQDSMAYVLENNIYQPSVFENSILHPDPAKLYSSGLSSVQALPNGNFLGCSGAKGYFVELTPDNEIVWEYKVPIKLGTPVPQGTFIDGYQNLTFRAFKYPLDYSAFNNRDLSPKGYIELQPNEGFCDSLTYTSDIFPSDIKLFPNPVSLTLNVSWSQSQIDELEVFDIIGSSIDSIEPEGKSVTIDVSDFDDGIYVIRLNKIKSHLFVVRQD